MQLYNPMPYVIEDEFNHFITVFQPGEIKSVMDDAGIHFIRRKRDFGLVELNYGFKEEEQFGSLSKYKESKAKEGLQMARARLLNDINQESMFPREVNLKSGGEVELSTTQIPAKQALLKQIDEMLNPKQESTLSVKEEVKELDEDVVIPKRRGRPPRVEMQELNG